MKRFDPTYAVNTYSYTLSSRAVDCVRHLAQLGVDKIELMMAPTHFWVDATTAQIAELRGALATEGVAALSMNASHMDLNLASASPEMRQYTMALNEGMIRIAGELGIKGFIVGPGKPNPLHPLPHAVLEGYFFKALDRLLPLAQACGVQLWVENMPFSFLKTVQLIDTSLASYGATEIGLCYDVANAHFIGARPEDDIIFLANKIDLIHISDTGTDVFKHDAIGLGTVDFAAIAAALTRIDYQQPIALEIISATPDHDLVTAAQYLKNLST